MNYENFAVKRFLSLRSKAYPRPVKWYWCKLQFFAAKHKLSVLKLTVMLQLFYKLKAVMIKIFGCHPNRTGIITSFPREDGPARTQFRGPKAKKVGT